MHQSFQITGQITKDKMLHQKPKTSPLFDSFKRVWHETTNYAPSCICMAKQRKQNNIFGVYDD